MSRRNNSDDTLDFEVGSDNVYADLGFDNASAMLRKARLVSKIGEVLDVRALTPAEAATLLGISRSTLSGMLRGHFRRTAERKLMKCVLSADGI
jgi:predicted XRE-type DNA-binding protein